MSEQAPSDRDQRARGDWAAHTELTTRFIPAKERDAEARWPDDMSVGKPVGNHIWELFVSCEPADGLALQFDARGFQFMALQALGLTSSRRFLAELAQARGCPLERLVIRRQGAGTVLAALYFSDIPASNGRVIRVYATEIISDSDATKATMQAMLLKKAQTAVALLGEMPGPELELGLVHLGRLIASGGNHHRTMVIQPVHEMPIGEAPVFRLGQEADIQVRRASAVRRPLEAWPFMSSTWLMNRASAGGGAVKPASPYDDGIPFELVASEPEPGLALGLPPIAGFEPAAMAKDPLQALVDGLVSWRDGAASCVFNARSLDVIARAGTLPVDTALLARQARMMVMAMQTGAQLLGVGRDVQEATVRLAEHHLIMRALPGTEGHWVVVMLQAKGAVDTRPVEAQVRRVVDQMPAR
jgi:hypothetical protein